MNIPPVFHSATAHRAVLSPVTFFLALYSIRMQLKGANTYHVKTYIFIHLAF